MSRTVCSTRTLTTNFGPTSGMRLDNQYRSSERHVLTSNFSIPAGSAQHISIGSHLSDWTRSRRRRHLRRLGHRRPTSRAPHRRASRSTAAQRCQVAGIGIESTTSTHSRVEVKLSNGAWSTATGVPMCRTTEGKPKQMFTGISTQVPVHTPPERGSKTSTGGRTRTLARSDGIGSRLLSLFRAKPDPITAVAQRPPHQPVV